MTAYAIYKPLRDRLTRAEPGQPVDLAGGRVVIELPEEVEGDDPDAA